MKAIVEGIKENLAAYHDLQDSWYIKLHLITAFHRLPEGPARPIPESMNQGTPMIICNHDLLKQNRHICCWNYNQTQFLNDINAQKAGKQFLQACIAPYILAPLRTRKIGLKVIKLRKMVNFLYTSYPSSEKEKSK